MAEKKKSAMNVPLRPLDNLFEPTIKEEPKTTGTNSLSLDNLHAFKGHPFKMYTEERMAEMVDSVKEHGVIAPILVRPNKHGTGYEIISGHNRVEACRRAGIKEIAGTQNTTSTSSFFTSGFNSSINFTVSLGVLFIFQFPAIIFLRIILSFLIYKIAGCE